MSITKSGEPLLGSLGLKIPNLVIIDIAVVIVEFVIKVEKENSTFTTLACT